MDDFIGQRFEKLVVVSRVDDYVAPSGGVHKKYGCMCDCGTYTEVLKEHLTSGRQKSCGCLRHVSKNKTHGEIRTRLYRIWGNMCNRCINPNNPRWKDYGGRGIFVCEEWRKYENFRDWAHANGYDKNLTIDRINNDDGYYPANCRWATREQQANNHRGNCFITYEGETRTLIEWARRLGIHYQVLYNRVKTLSWDIDRAFNQPVRKSPTRSNASNTIAS